VSTLVPISVFSSVQNIGIDLGGIAAFVALFIWDKKKENEQLERIARDETLSRLPLRLQSGKLVELSQLRENYRPVRSLVFLSRTVPKAATSLVFTIVSHGTSRFSKLLHRWISAATAVAKLVEAEPTSNGGKPFLDVSIADGARPCSSNVSSIVI
jgi:hypothetical protein